MRLVKKHAKRDKDGSSRILSDRRINYHLRRAPVYEARSLLARAAKPNNLDILYSYLFKMQEKYDTSPWLISEINHDVDIFIGEMAWDGVVQTGLGELRTALKRARLQRDFEAAASLTQKVEAELAKIPTVEQ